MAKLNDTFKLTGKILTGVKVLVILGIVVGVIVLLLAGTTLFAPEEAAADTAYMVSLLTTSSELTTAKLRYTGMTEYKDEGIDYINKSDFVMVYEATARIGINLEEVEVSADDEAKVIYVKIPQVTVQEVKIDTSTIKYFDQSFSLFNFDSKEDSNLAIKLAEHAALAEIREMGVLQMAQDQSATLIKGILANAIPDGYVIEILEDNG